MARILQLIGGVNATANPHTAIGVPAVLYCMELISNFVAQMPRSIVKIEPNGNRLEIPAHPYHYLMARRPNEDMTQFTYEKALCMNVLGWGDGFEYIETSKDNGRIKAFHLWHPNDVEVKRLDTGEKMYRNHLLGIEATPDQIIHTIDILLHPNHLRGTSRLTICREAVKENMNERQMVNIFYKTGLFLSAWLKWPGKLKDEDRQTLAEQFKQFWGGIRNAGKVLALEHNSELHQLSLPFKDWQFAERKGITTNEALIIFGLKPGNLGFSKEGESYNTLEQLNMERMQSPIMPLVINREQERSHKIFIGAERGKVFEHIDSNGVYRGTSSELESIIKAMGPAVTLNEIRKMRGLNTQEGLDVNLVQLGFGTLDQVKNGDNLKANKPQGRPPEEEKQYSENGLYHN